MHDRVDMPKFVQRLLEELRDFAGLGHIGLDGQRLSVGGCDFAHGLLRLGGVTGIVHHHGKSILGKPPRNFASDAARGSSDEGCLRHSACPAFLFPELGAKIRMRFNPRASNA